jgi:hypothetical protein
MGSLKGERIYSLKKNIVQNSSLFQRYLALLGPKEKTPLLPTCAPRRPDTPSLKPINYQLALSDLRQVIDSLGYNGADFSEHSMKRGAATASHDAGVSEPEIQHEGGWTSSRTVRLYIDRSARASQKIAKRLVARPKPPKRS